MRIDGFSNQQYNVGGTGEKSMGPVSGEALSDIVSFGSSLDSIFGETAAKSSFLDGTDGSMESMKEQAEILKNNLEVIFNKMDSGAVAQIDEDGIDINDMEADKVVTVVEQIQIKLAMYCDDFEATVNLDADEVKAVMGAGAAAYKLADKFRNNGVQPTEENVSEAMKAIEMASQIGNVDDGVKAYLLQNNMQFTVNNIYVAANAGYVNKTDIISDAEWSELVPQVNKVIEEAGFEVTDELQNRGRWMLDNDIDVTADNFNRLEALDNIENVLQSDELTDRIAAAMTEGMAAREAIISGEALPWEEAANAIITLENANEGNIMAFAYTEGNYNIETLSEIEIAGKELTPDRNDYKYIKTYRELMEVKLMMTIEAARTMEKNGISVNITDISQLIDKLKEYEADYFNANLTEGQRQVTTMDIEQINMVLTGVEGLKGAPSAVIGSVLEAGETATINSMSYHAAAVTAKLAAAGESYEALSTEIRSDLGDSVSKAIKASTADILSDMGYEDNEANRRAVRILAYNSMEINSDNIDKVKSIDYSTNELFRNMTPDKVLEMIRDDINPLETDVTELNNYFINNFTEQQITEKYSEFLYRMEKNNEITDEEREKFIGVYSLISKFEKDGMNVAGVLVNQGLELTIGNLLTAYMSRKDRNMDFKVTEETGMAQVSDKVTYYKNLFGKINGKVTPEALIIAGDKLDNMTPEEFSQIIEENPAGRDDVVYAKYVETIKEASHMEENILKFVTSNEIPATFNNLFAAQTLITNPRNIFGEYVYRTDMGNVEGIENEIMDALENKESAMEEYSDFVKKSRSLIEEAIGNTDSYMDMETLRQLGNGMKLLNTLAHRNNYHIPYEHNGNMGVINLKIVESGDNTGNFTIKMSDERYGDVTVEGKMDNNSLIVQIMCSEADGVAAIEEKKAELAEKLADNGVTSLKIYVNRAQKQPEGKSAVMEKASTEKIFKAAKIFIVGIAK